jgi:hypothetical protein
MDYIINFPVPGKPNTNRRNVIKYKWPSKPGDMALQQGDVMELPKDQWWQLIGVWYLMPSVSDDNLACLKCLIGSHSLYAQVRIFAIS